MQILYNSLLIDSKALTLEVLPFHFVISRLIYYFLDYLIALLLCIRRILMILILNWLFCIIVNNFQKILLFVMDKNLNKILAFFWHANLFVRICYIIKVSDLICSFSLYVCSLILFLVQVYTFFKQEYCIMFLQS